MATRLQFPGLCTYCGAEVTRKTAAEHLAKCKPRLAALKKAGRPSPHFPEEVFHIRAEATYLPEFWLDLEIRGETTFGELDHYLRAIWLECCGHMSAFTMKGWGTPQLAKEGSAGSVFRNLAKIMHVYDFGTESWTTIKRIGVRRGELEIRQPIKLLVRNQLPDVRCSECGEPAQRLCVQCVVEEDRMNFLCTKHIRAHGHDEYGPPRKIVNSPRLGLCGYTGPAKPPY